MARVLLPGRKSRPRFFFFFILLVYPPVHNVRPRSKLHEQSKTSRRHGVNRDTIARWRNAVGLENKIVRPQRIGRTRARGHTVFPCGRGRHGHNFCASFWGPGATSETAKRATRKTSMYHATAAAALAAAAASFGCVALYRVATGRAHEAGPRVHTVRPPYIFVLFRVYGR